MMRYVFVFLIFALSCTSVFAQTAQVDQTILEAGAANLFIESISLALNEKNGLTLVTWERHPGNHPGHDTLARRITRTGNLSATETLINGTNTYDPGIVYNKNRNQFALVYADEIGGNPHAIFIRALTKSGKKKGSPVKVSTDTGNAFANQGARVQYNPVRREYIVAWQRSSTTMSGSENGIYVAILNEQFQIRFGPQHVLTPVGRVFSDVRDIAVTSAGKIVIGINQFVNDNPLRVDYVVASMNPDLTGLVLSKLNGKPLGPQVPEIKFVSLPSELIAFYTSPAGIRKRKINEEGKPFGSRTAALAGAAKNKKLLLPVVAPLTTPAGRMHAFLVACEDPAQTAGAGTLWGQALDENGAAIGRPIELYSDFRALHSPAIVAFSSSTAAKAEFALIYSDGAQIFLPPQGEFSRLIYLKIAVDAL